MLQSMTGFISKTVQLTLEDKTKITLTIHIKSLNSRFFETTCKLPYVLNQFETDFIQLFKTKLSRGHIFFTVHMSNQNIFKDIIEPSLNTVESYKKAVDLIKNKTGVAGEFTISDLLALPNVFVAEEREVDQETKQIIFNTTETLVDELVKIRTREGETLENDMKKSISNLEKEIIEIEKLSKEMVERQKLKISENFSVLEEGLREMKQEALFNFLDKIDVHEEIVRFKSHLANLGNIFKLSEKEKGKRLDFTLQELLREINTIASKCSDAAIGTQAINIKVELEKIREQAQNIV